LINWSIDIKINIKINISMDVFNKYFLITILWIQIYYNCVFQSHSSFLAYRCDVTLDSFYTIFSDFIFLKKFSINLDIIIEACNEANRKIN